MKNICIFLSLLGMCIVDGSAQRRADAWELSSPDNTITVEVRLSSQKHLEYAVKRKGTDVLEFSSLGLLSETGDFFNDLSVQSISKLRKVEDKYEMQQGKKLKCIYEGNERTVHLTNANGASMDVIFRVSNDGVAFRYYFPARQSGAFKIQSENTSFNFPSNAKGFLQPMSVAKTGWSRVNPCYEEFYEKGIPVGKSSPSKAGWVFPALFQVGDHWILITETGVDKNYCGSHLASESPEGNYALNFPQPQEFFPGGGILPVLQLPAYTPWRIMAIGSLKTIVESTLGTDLADAAKPHIDKKFIKPGHSSWSWALLKDDSIVFDVQKRFVDYASSMGWDYCLVDVNWDQKIGYERIGELSRYAHSKNVGLILWYNSAGDWNDTPYTPKNMLLTHESRLKEFSRLRDIGIKGLKIDFFGGDGQSVMDYYIGILEDAAANNLLVNFHGGTVPRGWHRTYPNLMTCEAIKGFEYVTFEQVNADEQPSHCAVLPFTRNAFDPMDFTPLSLYKVPNINRLTSSAYELALSVVFLSGLQHFVETPSGMKHVPDYVQAFLRDVPVAWDETRFISGYPGESVVLARRSGDVWYVAGINGKNESLKIKPDLSFIGKGVSGYVIKDGNAPLSFQQESINSLTNANIDLPGYGGFVMVLKSVK